MKQKTTKFKMLITTMLSLLLILSNIIEGVCPISIYAADKVASSIEGFYYQENTNGTITCTSDTVQEYNSYDEAVEKLSILSRKLLTECKYENYSLDIPVKINSDVAISKIDEKNSKAFNTDVYNETYKETGNPDEGYMLKTYCGTRGLLQSSSGGQIVYEDQAYSGVLYYSNAGHLKLSRYNESVQKIKNIVIKLNIADNLDYEKCKAIMVWIGNNVKYDGYYIGSSDTPKTKNPHDMTGPVLDGWGVCDGYAETFYYMANLVGLHALYDDGTMAKNGHAWNLVQIDGTYYYIDPSGDASSLKSGTPTKEFLDGSITHKLENYISNDKTIEETYTNISEDDYFKEHSSCNGNHDFSEKATGGAYPTCTNDGYDAFQCKNCKYIKKEVIPALGHNLDSGEVTQEATCTLPEITTYTCQRGDEVYPSCHAKITKETKAALGHDYNGEVTTKEATCTEDGYIKTKCTRCDDLKTEVIPKTGHQHTEIRNAKEATCSKDGYTGDIYCTDCNTKIKSGTVIKATNHDYVETITKQPTCTSTGTATYTCTKCGDSDTKILSKVAHKYVETKEPATCTRRGRKVFTCNVCGDSYWETDDDAPKLDHEYEVTLDEAPTCTEDGCKIEKCKNCDNEKYTTIPATGHIHEELLHQKNATCEEEGYTGDLTCTDCNTVLQKGSVIAALGHAWDDGVVTKEATYESDGEKTFTCSNCKKTKTEVIPMKQHTWDSGKITKEPTCIETGIKLFTCTEDGCDATYEEVIAATGHQNTEIQNKKDVTCSEDGYTGDTYCKDCKQVIKAGEKINATGHDYESKVTTPATCKEAGVKTYTCKKCKDTYTETIPKTESHKWDEGTVTKKATCTETGIKTFTCSVCHTTKTEVIPKSDSHNYDEGVVTKNPTCDTLGEKTFTCKDCKETKIEVLKALGHNYGEWTTVSETTVFAPELRKHTCERCGKVETSIFGAKLNPTISLNKTSISLYYARTNDAIKVSGLANGDSVKSFTSSNTKIATVNGSGKVYAKGNGKATITITLASGLKKTVNVTVTSSIRNVPTKKTIKRKKSYTLKPKVYLLGKVKYKTSNKKIATVSSKGKITAKKKKGKVKITAYSGSKKVVCTITVK
ncbi:MAG: Ig-like domain-containing protein [Anaerostipes sp.]|nr:Ig-like domain-containing protein [Anaerostipes sp.]